MKLPIRSLPMRDQPQTAWLNTIPALATAQSSPTPQGQLGEIVTVQLAIAQQSSWFDSSTLQHLLTQAGQCRDSRWLTVVTDQPVARGYWQQLGIDPHRMRLVQLRNPSDLLWVTWEALATGNSHTVFATTNHLDAESRQHLATAAQLGQTQGILLSRQPIEQPSSLTVQ